jgi:hypothetical protein
MLDHENPEVTGTGPVSRIVVQRLADIWITEPMVLCNKCVDPTPFSVRDTVIAGAVLTRRRFCSNE